MDNTTKIVLTLHIAAAVLWVGGGTMVHIFGRRALASGDRSRMLEFSKDADAIGPRFFAPLSIVLLLCGFELVHKYGYKMSDTFVSLGMAGWVVSFLIGVGYYSQAAKKRDRIIESDGLESEAFMAQYRQVANVSAFETLILILVVIDMAWKPGL